MKKIISLCLVVLILFALVPQSFAASEKGEAVLYSEVISGNVGDVILVNIFLERNCEGDAAIDSMQGTLIYDTEYLTYGNYKLTDEVNDLSSVSNEASGMWQVNEKEKGSVLFAFASAFGINQDGFLVQFLFRIEKEGGTRLVLNNFEYSTWSRSSGNTASYYLEPFYVCGVVTEGYEVDLSETPDEEFESLSKQTVTPKPNQDKATPVPSKSVDIEIDGTPLPEELIQYSPKPSEAPGTAIAPASNAPSNTEAPTDSATAEPATQAPSAPAVPDEADKAEDEPAIEVDVEEIPPTDTPDEGDAKSQPEDGRKLGVAAWILIGLGVLAVVLLTVAISLLAIRKRNK